MVDFLPTLVNLAGGEVPANVDGKDQWASLLSQICDIGDGFDIGREICIEKLPEIIDAHFTQFCKTQISEFDTNQSESID